MVIFHSFLYVYQRVPVLIMSGGQMVNWEMYGNLPTIWWFNGILYQLVVVEYENYKLFGILFGGSVGIYKVAVVYLYIHQFVYLCIILPVLSIYYLATYPHIYLLYLCIAYYFILFVSMSIMFYLPLSLCIIIYLYLFLSTPIYLYHVLSISIYL